MSRVFRWVVTVVEDWLGALFLAASFSAVCLQVFCRYVLSSPLVWAEEAAVYSYIWLVYAGATVAIRKNTHVRVEVLVAGLPGRARAAIELVTTLMSTAFLGFLFVSGIKFLKFMWNVTSPAIHLPMWLLFLVIPLYSALMIVHQFSRVRDLVTAVGRPGRPGRRAAVDKAGAREVARA